MDSEGYGRITIGDTSYRTHRILYTMLRGTIPKGMTLDHLCHTIDTDCPGGSTCPHRRCGNPWHMEVVPIEVNILRGRGVAAFNAQKVVCKYGHDNWGPRKSGGRYCRTCARERSLEWLARNPNYKHPGKRKRDLP